MADLKNTNAVVYFLRKEYEEKYTNYDASFEIGRIYENGRIVQQCYGTAAEYYTKGSKNGHAESTYRLGYLHYCGYFFPCNMRKGLELYELAAEQGSKNAQYWAGRIYKDGEQVTRDLWKAKHYFKLSAAQGHEDASIELVDLESKEYNIKSPLKIIGKVYNIKSIIDWQQI